MCIDLSVHLGYSLLIKDVKRLRRIHAVQISNMQYASGVCMGRFCILNFTQFSQRPFLPKTTLVDKLTCTILVVKCTEKYLSDKNLARDI